MHALNYNVALHMDFIQNNLLLVAVALASGAMLAWPYLRRGTGGPWASALQATQMINREDALVLDLRDAAEYARGHIIGAKNVPLADLERRVAEFDKHKARPVIVHCDTGSLANRAVGVLKDRGFASVHNLAGGYRGWLQGGLPVEK